MAKREKKESRPALTAEDIQEGHWYRAKHPREVGWPPEVNDRRVIHISIYKKVVQYDGPSVAIGAHFPKVSMDQFLYWVSHDVTEPAKTPQPSQE